MLFNSYVFIFAFLPVVLLGFAWLSQRGDARLPLAFLLLSSFLFYGWWDPACVPLLLASIAVNYGIGHCQWRARSLGDHGSRAWLVVAVVFNLSLLGIFKYAGFFAEIASALAGRDSSTVAMVLPLAISFFTFQQIAYAVDCYHGLVEDRSFQRYALFVAFFPQLIAGPIVHHREILPQLAAATGGLRWRNLSVGFSFFALGLFKKVVLADGIGFHSDAVFDTTAAGGTPDFFAAWGGALAYSLQLYFDFSGYSDMAIGLGRLFGIRLPVNFDSPYKATSLIDFWRRWHMTLSRFLRDYLYIPLGGRRRGNPRRYANLVVTMLLGGLWHGAGWTFVAWGALHAFYLLINHAWRSLAEGHSLPSTRSRMGAYRALTLAAVIVAWVLFRADSIGDAGHILSAMFGLSQIVLGVPTDAANIAFTAAGWGWCALLLAIATLAPNSQQILEGLSNPKEAETLRVPQFVWRPNLAWAAATGALLAVSIHELSRATQFLYFQF